MSQINLMSNATFKLSCSCNCHLSWDTLLNYRHELFCTYLNIWTLDYVYRQLDIKTNNKHAHINT